MCLCSNVHHESLFIKAGPRLDSQKPPPHDPRPSLHAFSIGRTQELLFELEEITHRNAQKPAAHGVNWADLDIVVDSPPDRQLHRRPRPAQSPLGR
jgi:hypothetical protein